MATVVLQAAGQGIGTFLGGTAGGMIGRAVGAVAGNLIDQQLFGSTRKTEGPRLSDLRVMSSSEGAPIPCLWGRMRVAGQVIWATHFEEVAATDTQGASSKGGGGGGTKVTTYSYFANFAVALCEGEIDRIGRVWADGKDFDISAAAVRLHTGSETQEPDSLIAAKEGAGNAPAYRGVAYVVFERLALEPFGNRLPQLSFEVLRSAGGAENQIRAVNIIPGSTEFGYDTAIVTRTLEEGVTSAEIHDLTITDNVFTDAIVVNSGTAAPAPATINVSSITPKGGTATNSTIPGDYDSMSGTIIKPWNWYQADYTNAADAIGRMPRTVIANNTMARTLPNAAAISALGYGSVIRSGLVYDPAMTDTNQRPTYGILMGAIPAFGELEISGNVISNAQNAIGLPAIASDKDYQNVAIRNNRIKDCYIRGIQINGGAFNADLLIEGNEIDGDPLRLNANSHLDGHYLADGTPWGIDTGSVKGVRIERNKFRNVCKTVQTNGAASVVQLDNVCFASTPAALGFSTSNKGIGNIPSGDGWEIQQEDSDPTSATYKQFTQKMVRFASAKPVAGWYYAGWVVRNTAAANAGWHRLTTGTGHVLNADWAEIPLNAANSWAAKQTFFTSTTGSASATIPPGAPSAPVNGDVWTTTAGLFCRVNGASVQFSINGHTHAASEISDATAAGRAMLTAASAAAQTALLDASGLLTKLQTVDGPGSGLDADLLDGLSSAAFATASHTHTASEISDATAAGRSMLTAADAAAQTALLNAVTSGAKGLAPASGGGTANFLRADGSWAVPIAGTAAQYNQSVGSQGAGFASDTYLTGSSIAIPSGSLKAGARYRLVFDVSKTAAGTAAPAIILRFGTNGTTADAALATLTFLAQTAVADDGLFEVLATFRSVGSGTAAVVQAVGTLTHRLQVTGLANLPSPTVRATSAGFDSTTAGAILGVSVNGGASAAWTVQLVQANLENLN